MKYQGPKNTKDMSKPNKKTDNQINMWGCWIIAINTNDDVLMVLLWLVGVLHGINYIRYK